MAQIGLDPTHLRLYVVRPALSLIGAWSREAEELVMGTAAAESQLRHLRQLGGGPARGLWQMEGATHDDCWANYLDFRKTIGGRVAQLLIPGMSRLDQLAGNLPYAAAMCRVRYLRDAEPLPAETDVPGMAATWKRVYNTRGGAGTVEHFVSCYRTLIAAAPSGA